MAGYLQVRSYFEPSKLILLKTVLKSLILHAICLKMILI